MMSQTTQGAFMQTTRRRDPFVLGCMWVMP